MKSNDLPSLITSNPATGLALAADLAARLHAGLDKAADGVERPGGTNYLLPPPVPKESIAGILFYAIAAANQGWTKQS